MIFQCFFNEVEKQYLFLWSPSFAPQHVASNTLSKISFKSHMSQALPFTYLRALKTIAQAPLIISISSNIVKLYT